MNEIKQQLINQAHREYRSISPCTAKATLQECFTQEAGMVCFWFNTADETTHMLVAELR
ncbi:MAG: hypothetical protein GF398_04955 [Chitinivibrionales bacterium]|nr:hypothetical protein [Chitinivibrionales bacterium]